MAPDDMEPKQESKATCELFCFATLANINSVTIYTDLLRKFLTRSNKGHQFILMTYVANVNTILV